MIADALRIEVEAHAERVRRGNPLLNKAAAGAVTPAAVERYLVTSRYMIANTIPNLARARDRARERKLQVLATYFAGKIGEETGHEVWADDDLVVLRNTYGMQTEVHPVSSALELNRFLCHAIEQDPTLYLAYILWAEYFATLVGGELTRYLVERCSVPVQALTCLANHVKLDQAHTEENFEAIDILVEDPRSLKLLRGVLYQVMAFFDRACEEFVCPQRIPRPMSEAHVEVR